MAARVFDADGHICEPPALWNDYIPAKYRENAIRIERGDDGFDRTFINGVVRTDLLPAMACIPAGMKDPDNPPTWDDITLGSYLGSERVAVMDEEGIARALLYPSMYLLHGDIEWSTPTELVHVL